MTLAKLQDTKINTLNHSRFHTLQEDVTVYFCSTKFNTTTIVSILNDIIITAQEMWGLCCPKAGEGVACGSNILYGDGSSPRSHTSDPAHC